MEKKDKLCSVDEIIRMEGQCERLKRENEKLKADMEAQLREILRLSDGQKRCYCPYCGEKIR